MSNAREELDQSHGNPRSKRVVHGGQVAFKARFGDNETGRVGDVSESGALLISPKRLAKGTEVMIYLPLELGKKNSLCMVSGKIVRVVEQKRKYLPSGYGVIFDEAIPVSSKQMIRDFVYFKVHGKLPDKEVDDSIQKKRISPFRD